MGVSFTEIHGEDQAALEDLVNWLAGSLPQGTAQDARPSATTNEEDSMEARTVTLHSDLDTASALDALLKLLEGKGVVSAEECVKVAQKIDRYPSGRLDAKDGSALNPALRASD